MTATERIAELLYRNFRRYSGRVMRPAGAPPSKSSTQTTACSMFRTASSLDTPHWTNSPGNYARPIRILSTHRMDRPRPYTTGEFLLGARARKASRPNTPGSMLSLFVRARLLSCTSFSIRNCPLPSTTSTPPGTWPSCTAISPFRRGWPAAAPRRSRPAPAHPGPSSR